MKVGEVMTDTDNGAKKSFDVVDYLKDNLPNVPVEVGRAEKRRLTNQEKADIIADEAQKQAVEIEDGKTVINKSHWVQKERDRDTHLVCIKYRNQLIPISGRQTKIRTRSRQDAVLVLKKLADSLRNGEMDELMDKVKERKRRTKKPVGWKHQMQVTG